MLFVCLDAHLSPKWTHLPLHYIPRISHYDNIDTNSHFIWAQVLLHQQSRSWHFKLNSFLLLKTHLTQEVPLTNKQPASQNGCNNPPKKLHFTAPQSSESNTSWDGSNDGKLILSDDEDDGLIPKLKREAGRPNSEGAMAASGNLEVSYNPRSDKALYTLIWPYQTLT